MHMHTTSYILRLGACKTSDTTPMTHRVTRNEAERWEENRVDREEKARVLREQLIHEFESKGLPVPEVLQQHPSRR